MCQRQPKIFGKRFLWAQLVTAIISFFISSGLGFLLGTVINRLEPSERTFRVNELGYHCVRSIFEDAKESSVDFSAEKNVKSMGICGPATITPTHPKALKRLFLSQKKIKLQELLYFLEKRHPYCFKVESKKSGNLKISANVDGEKSEVIRETDEKTGSEIYFCRCDPDMVDLIMRKSEKICGMNVHKMN